MFLSIIFFVVVGRIFYNLCDEYNKSKWYTALGIVSYFLGEFIVGIILGASDTFFDLGIDWNNSIIIIIVGLFSGIGSCLIVYYILQSNWKKEALKNRKELNSNINDIGNTPS